MPAPVYINFDALGQVPATPRRLRTVLSAVLDLPPGVSPGRATQFPTLAHRPVHGSGGVRPYSLGELGRSGSIFGVEMRFLDDRLVDVLDARLSWGDVMCLGIGIDDDAVLAAVKGQVIAQKSWEEFVKRDGDTTWEVRLMTLTTFSGKGQYVPGLNPAAIATNLQQKWWAWSRRLAPPRINQYEMASVLATQDYARSSMVSLATPRNSDQSRLSSRRVPVHEGYPRIGGVGGAEATRVFSCFVALSVYANVDPYTSYDMGAVDAVVV